MNKYPQHFHIYNGGKHRCPKILSFTNKQEFKQQLNGYFEFFSNNVEEFYRNDNDKLDYDGYKLIKIKLNNLKQINIVKRLENDYQMDYWNDPIVYNNKQNDEPQYIMTVIDKQRLKFLTKLNESNITFEILSNNYKNIINMERIEMFNAKLLLRNNNEFNYGNYHTYDELKLQIRNLVEKYSNISEKLTIGYSYEGREIFGIKIGNPIGKTIIVECGIHAREWISPAYCIWLAGQLLTNNNLSIYHNRYNFIIIPSLNVDGYVFTHTHQRLWRKTRSRRFGTFCVGADPNRNFDSAWCKEGSSNQPCSDTYCGKNPFSEIESRHMANLLYRYQKNIFAYFCIHSYSQLWMFPFGYTKNPVNNYQQLSSVSMAAVNAIKSVYGTEYKYGSIANIIYTASGSSVDYAYEKLNIKNAFVLELRDNGKYGFQLPIWQILPTCIETWTGMKTAIDELEKLQ